MRQVVLVILVLCVLWAVVGCGDGGDDESDLLPPEAGVAPTKGQVIVFLGDFLDALEDGELERAQDFIEPRLTRDKGTVRKRLSGLVRKGGISRAGLGLLAERGRFGPLTRTLGDKGAAWARKAGIDPEKCHALASGRATVVVHWGGEDLRILHLDSVGKLR